VGSVGDGWDGTGQKGVSVSVSVGIWMDGAEGSGGGGGVPLICIPSRKQA